MIRFPAYGRILVLAGALVSPPRSVTAQVTQLTGELVSMIAESFQREASIDFTLVLEDRSSLRLTMEVELLRPFGGVRAMDHRRVLVQGVMQPELKDPVTGAVLRSFVVQGIRPLGPQPAYAAAMQLTGPVAGRFRWIVLGCRFSDRPTFSPVPSSLWPVFVGSAPPGLDSYWQEVSGGRVNLTGSSAISDWVVLPQPRSYYTPGFSYDAVKLRTDCIAAADAQVDFTQYDGIIMVFNDYLYAGSSNSFASFAFFSPMELMLEGQTKAYRLMHISYGHERSLSVWAHEMGHTFGFPHSAGARQASRFPYDSWWDVMSDGAVNNATILGTVPVHTIAYHKALAGWITPAETFMATTGSRTIRVERGALPQGMGNYRLIQIPIPSEAGAFYTVEVRQPAGYDAAGPPRGLPGDGVVIHRVDPDGDLFNPNQPRATIVDGDLGNSSVNDQGAVWTPGETFTDANNGITVAVAAASGSTTSYDVTVSVGAPVVAVLANRSTVGPLSGGAQSMNFQKITVPAGTRVLTLTATGGLGDADLYVKRGRVPTLLNFDYATGFIGNVERLAIANPAAGDWYVMLYGWAAYNGLTLSVAYGDFRIQVVAQPTTAVSGKPFTTPLSVQLLDEVSMPLQLAGLTVSASVSSGAGALFGATTASTLRVSSQAPAVKLDEASLPMLATTAASGVATFSSTTGISGTGPHTIAFNVSGFPASPTTSIQVSDAPLTELTPGTPVSGLSATSGSTTLYRLRVAAGAAGVSITTSGGTGDLDLYVRRGSAPTTDLYDCRGFTAGNSHSCSIGAPTSTDIYVMLRAFSTYSGATLAPVSLTQKLLIVTEPAGASAGVVFLQQPSVRLAMSDNTPLALAGIPISVGLVQSGTISGTPLSANTDATGLATFSGVRISGSGTYNLQFNATGYGQVLSQPLVVSSQNFIAVAGVGTGSGSVTGTGINCTYTPASGRSGSCVTGYPATTTVVLTGTGAPGSVFLGWGASICSGGAPCTLPMSTTYPIKAYFADAATLINGAIAQLLGTPTFTVVETQLIDDQGNKNGGADLGDLLALLDRTGTSITPAILDALARIAAAHADTSTIGRIKR